MTNLNPATDDTNLVIGLVTQRGKRCVFTKGKAKVFQEENTAFLAF